MINSDTTRFAIIGLGGLGGPIALALAAAGAHRLSLVDPDRVELSNLQRQLQFSTANIGTRKVHALTDELVRRGASRNDIRCFDTPFDQCCASEILAEVDILIEATDDFSTKFLVNDLAASRQLPCIISAVTRYQGQVMSLPARRDDSGCYRCLFEQPPDDEDAQSCANAGVFGAAVAVVAGYAAKQALLLASLAARSSQLFVFHDLKRAFEPRVVSFIRRVDCPACAAQPDEIVSKAREAL